MTLVAIIEGLAALAAVAALGALIVPSRSGRLQPSILILLLLLGIQAIIHLSDVVEWSGHLEMDQLGDNLRVLVPLLWLIATFSLHRESMSEELDAERNQNEFFLEQSPLAVCMYEEGGRIIGVSREWAENFGLERARFVGVDFVTAPGLPEEFVRRVNSAVAKCKGGTVESDHAVQVVWGGRREWVDWQVRVGDKGHSGPRRVTLVADVVTQKQEREFQARRDAARLFEEHRVELVGQLAASVAHDLNNFLTSITVNAELLPTRSGDNDLSEAREAIMSAAESSADLVRSLNGVARARGSQSQIEVPSLLRATFDLIHRTFPVDVAVVQDLPDRPLYVQGDRGRLQQAFVNLLVNARDAMGSHGTLTLTVEEYESDLLVHVQDTGVGIPEDIQDRVFERFFTTKASLNGTGLGLALVQTVAREHSGSVALKSRVGQGTTVSLRIPLATREPWSEGEESTATVPN